ncbi:hypothetical protein Lalb_Chr23g0270841 [Lupinus albus]|uniref:Uncharacterized protein n=1 Tax=Lupinus albus TaxID=3870 RepID=A0A6A4NBG9_LUPAL|nr:hypothetical protein Lalb_Chr23g0270841 [Lupinus albus]
MSKPKTNRKPTIIGHVSNNQNQKTEKQPSWSVKGFLACRNFQIQQQQPKQPQHLSETKQPSKKHGQKNLQENEMFKFTL